MGILLSLRTCHLDSFGLSSVVTNLETDKQAISLEIPVLLIPDSTNAKWHSDNEVLHCGHLSTSRTSHHHKESIALTCLMSVPVLPWNDLHCYFRSNVWKTVMGCRITIHFSDTFFDVWRCIFIWHPRQPVKKHYWVGGTILPYFSLNVYI